MPISLPSGWVRLSHRTLMLVGGLLTLSQIAGCNLDLVQSTSDLKKSVHQSLEQHNYADATKQAQRLTEKEPDDADGHYLLAQAQTQTGDRMAAIVSLERAIHKGLTDDREIERNPRLVPLHSTSAYADLMNSSFPERRRRLNSTAASVSASVSTEQSGNTALSATASQHEASDVSIESSTNKQVVRAGDIVIELPTAK